MTTEDVASLPWQELKHTEGEIPWPLLERFADALAANEAVFPRLQEIYGAAVVAENGRPSYECLYVPAIMGLAAPQLTGATRQRVAEFLVVKVMDAGMTGDDLPLEVLESACGAIGPAIVPMVLDAMPLTFQPLDATFSLWSLAAMAAKSDDPAVRQRTIDLCLKALGKAESGRNDITDVEPAAQVLAVMQHREARPLIQRLCDKTGDIELRDDLDLMDGVWEADVPLYSWEDPIRETLTENWEALRQWYTERDTSPDIIDPDDDEDDMDEEWDDDEIDVRERRAVELAERFADSRAAGELPADLRPDAAFIAECVLQYASSHGGVRPEELDEQALREVLLEVLPQKMSTDKDFYEKVAPVTAALVTWLGTEGIVKNAPALAAAVNDWSERIVSNGMDRSRWGMAKHFAMMAHADGVDMDNPAEMKQFIKEYNRRIAGSRGISGGGQGIVPGATSNSSAKVGRNDPCPCGSGKKYKKCCMRRPDSEPQARHPF